MMTFRVAAIAVLPAGWSVNGRFRPQDRARIVTVSGRWVSSAIGGSASRSCNHAWQTLTVALTGSIRKSLHPPDSPAEVSQPARSGLGFRRTLMTVTIGSIVRFQGDDPLT